MLASVLTAVVEQVGDALVERIDAGEHALDPAFREGGIGPLRPIFAQIGGHDQFTVEVDLGAQGIIEAQAQEEPGERGVARDREVAIDQALWLIGLARS
jgi:hypothetical protein